MTALKPAGSLNDLPAVIYAQSHFVCYQTNKTKTVFVKNEYSTAHFAGG
jgi:hypothetical protein